MNLARIRLPRFAIGLLLVVLLAVAMTSVSVYMYARSGVLNLDLSRPGYEQARKEIRTHDNEPTFSSSGKLDTSAMADFSKLYKTQVDQLTGNDTFSEATLSDLNIGLPAE